MNLKKKPFCKVVFHQWSMIRASTERSLWHMWHVRHTKPLHLLRKISQEAVHEVYPKSYGFRNI